MTKQDRNDLSNIVNIFNYICYRHRGDGSRGTCNSCPFYCKMMNACSQIDILNKFKVHNINLIEIWGKEHNADGQTN